MSENQAEAVMLWEYITCAAVIYLLLRWVPLIVKDFLRSRKQ